MFYFIQLYKKLADSELGDTCLDETVGDERERQVALLTQARNSLYETLDRIRGDRFHVSNFYRICKSTIKTNPT